MCMHTWLTAASTANPTAPRPQRGRGQGAPVSELPPFSAPKGWGAKSSGLWSHIPNVAIASHTSNRPRNNASHCSGLYILRILATNPSWTVLRSAMIGDSLSRAACRRCCFRSFAPGCESSGSSTSKSLAEPWGRAAGSFKVVTPVLSLGYCCHPGCHLGQQAMIGCCYQEPSSRVDRSSVLLSNN